MWTGSGRWSRRAARRVRWAGAAVLSGVLVIALAAPVGAVGSDLWSRRYNGPADNHDGANAIALSPNGTSVFVTGYSTAANLHSDFLTYGYRASDGADLWTVRFNGSGNGSDIAKAIAVSPDGTKVFVTGLSAAPGGYLNYVTFAYRASDGAVLWGRRYSSGALHNDVATAIAVSRDGTKVFVTGYSDGSGAGSDYITAAYGAANGAALWIRRYDGTGHGNDTPSAIAVSPDSTKVFVTGYSTGGDANADYLTYAYSASNGASLWSRRYNGTGNRDDYASAIAVSRDATKVVVTGRSAVRDNTDDYVTFAYRASDGAILWGRRYNGTANRDDAARAVAISHDGTKVVVTGRSAGVGSNDDFLTYAYRASDGASLWSRRDNGTANNVDIAVAVVVSLDATRVVRDRPQ